MGVVDLIDISEAIYKHQYKFMRDYPELQLEIIRKQRLQAERRARAPRPPRPSNGYPRNTELIAYRKSLGRRGYHILSAKTRYAISSLKSFEYGHRRTPEHVMDYIRANPVPQHNNL